MSSVSTAEVPQAPPSYEEAVSVDKVIAELALADIQTLQDAQKGKSRASVQLTDEELALQLFAEEANALLLFAEDAAFARSLADAVDADRTLLEQLARDEVTARADREMATALQNNQTIVSRPSTPASVLDLDDEDIRKTLMSLAPAFTQSEGTSSTSNFASSSNAQLPSHSVSSVTEMPLKNVRFTLSFADPPNRKREDCVICGDNIDGHQVRAPCGHFYDTACLRDLFRSASVDESLFPPRCCQRPFVFSEVQHYLGADIAATFQKKAVEFSTLDRVYCHRPACSAFIGAATSIASSQCCPECWVETCGRCKEAAHMSTFCPRGDAEDASVLEMAENEGWKRCPGCRHLVELTHGCYHMTCRCRKQFCYVCTETWKNCSCPQWEEQRLYATAEDHVRRVLPPGPPPAAPALNHMVIDMAERLRADHECVHNWHYRRGAGLCESCNVFWPRYLLQCAGCRMCVCVRCQRNRM